MTDLSQLTLAEVEALAERLGNAARTIREAQAMLSGGGQATHISTPAGVTLPDAIAAGTARAIAVAPASMFSASELAERNRLLKQFKPEDMPPDVAAAMKDA